MHDAPSKEGSNILERNSLSGGRYKLARIPHHFGLRCLLLNVDIERYDA